MYQIVQPDSFSPLDSVSPLPGSHSLLSVPPAPLNASQISLPPGLVHPQERQDLPVGELFRTLQIWFDQEGFREIAPIFTFNCYSQEDDLLYFTTERVGYPFHYDPMQQVPVLRKVVAPDYEEAYALLEGKASRDAAGRRDFLSRQASLNMKHAGRYVVEDTEGRGKWIWRLIYEVEDRKSLMGKPMNGERAFIPITFACSPEVLDPSHARKPTILNAIIKNLGSKKASVALDADGRPLTRPRGKSLITYHSRKRSDSAAKLLQFHTLPQHALRPTAPVSDPSPLPSTPSSNKTSTAPSHSGDELSLAQAHFFRAITPASASPLRPLTAQPEDQSLKRSIRKAKTSEHLRRPFTADAIGASSAPPLPSFPALLPNVTPVFGIAPQPSRATPSTHAKRFHARPKTSEGCRSVRERRPMTARSQIDMSCIAAASFFTPPGVSA